MTIERAGLPRVMRPTTGRIAAVILTAAAAAVVAQDAPRVPVGKLKDHRGRVVTVCGKVVTHNCAKDRATVLDLDKPYWSKPAAILIPESARRRFPVRLEDRYTLTKLCATGVVERREDRDMVRVDDPANIIVEQELPPVLVPADTRRPCDPGVEMPTVVREVKPSYTREAMRGLQQGLVVLEALVMADGTVGGARVVDGPQPRLGLDEEAVKAIRRWEFKPGTLDGRPVPVIVLIELAFRLK